MNAKKNKHAVALGKLGGKKGGPARAAKLTKERKKEIAIKAITKRWSNKVIAEPTQYINPQPHTANYSPEFKLEID